MAQATLAYDEERYDDALAMLKEALALDPENARALYYQGLVYLALDNPQPALESLQAGLRISPTDLFIRFQLGVAYFALQDYDEAEPLLTEVFSEQPQMDSLGFYVGFLRYRRGAYEEALEAFKSGRTSDPNIQQLNLFYKGLILGILGLPDRAISELQAAMEQQETQAATPITGAAIRLREALRASRSAEKRFRAQVSVGGFYDDNVRINPNSSKDPVAEELRSESTTSPGFLSSALLDYSWLRRGPWESTISYSFYSTVNTNSGLSRFDIMDNLGSLSGFYRGTAWELPYQLALTYTLDYLFLDQAAFLFRNSGTASATLIEPVVSVPLLGDVGNLTTFLGRYQKQDFFQEADIRFGRESQDGYNTMVGFLHVFRFAQDSYLLRIGYQYDNENTKTAQFSYSGNRLQTGGQASLPWGDMSLNYSYDVHWRAYKHPQTRFVDDRGVLSQRFDIQQTHLVQLVKPLPYHYSLTAQYQGTFNDSNVPVYDYDKNVFSIILTWIY